MRQNWYTKWFSSKYYLILYKHRDTYEAKVLIDLIQRFTRIKIGSKALDVCCGEGRHSIELARRGYDVTGIDLSEYLINAGIIRLKSIKEKGLRIRFERKDMRNFNYKKSFDIAINIFSSFGYFKNDKENFLLFKNVKNSLKNGGWFVFDYLNSIFVKKNLIPENQIKLGKIKIIQKRRIFNGFIIKDIIIGKDKFQEKLKLYSPEIIKNILDEFGFKIINILGDYYGNKFSEEKSERIIIFAKKSEN